ncbi:TRAP transporter substrate-binding protein DctP [Telmatospirillum siberiense]|uniref:ABC transporter substrate-binding protein n=1 Tax=Telmatospirillum siberiense TaxID=382514 RepID=A0A2N3PWT0_9PROT|nr:TRAP transporter substrate-binding protein DctP [Telmatospirillum siberiense]PKU24850.1 hypothetical protein CWS72_09730 [Telmatospirillum siberiense]
MRPRLVSLVTLCCGLSLSIPAGGSETLIFAHLYSETSVQHQVLLAAGRDLARRSGDQVRLEIKPRGQMGDQDSRIMEAIAFGQADMTFAGGPFLARDYAPMGVISAPFVFRDFTHWQHFRASPLARQLADDYEKASGMTLLGFYYNGLRHLNSKQPVRHPEDLIGLKVRVPNAPIYLQLFRALGAMPVPTSYEHAYEALKQGTADAEENPITTIEDGKFFDVAPFVSLTGHILDTGVILIAGKRLASLTENQRALVREIFGQVADQLTEQVHDRETDALEKRQRIEGRVIPFDRDALARKAASIVQGSDLAWSGKLYNRVQKIP